MNHLALVLSLACFSTNPDCYDVVVYGGTSAGVTAAIQTARQGKSVVLIEPTQHLGGLTSSGLGETDAGRAQFIGGLSREFYKRIKSHYDDDAAWKQQRKQDYAQYRPKENAMWKFEPHVAEKVFDQMVSAYPIKVVKGKQLDPEGVIIVAGDWRHNNRIGSIRMTDGTEYCGKMFIDATYEGDLMAASGVQYTVGREGNAQYGELYNGVQKYNEPRYQLTAPLPAAYTFTQFIKKVDPYITPGVPSSGLLPGINAKSQKTGDGDKMVQAYCFRTCLTDDPQNRVPFEKPEGYDELEYELLLRNFEAGDHRLPLWILPMPNRKADTNNRFAFSLDYMGRNHNYPEASAEERKKIIEDHKRFQKGLMWTLANHPRVPEKIRKEVSRWGLAKDEFVDNGNWPYQIYVREGRRMISDYVITQHDCFRKRIVDDPVGMGSYQMDSHNCQRFVTDEGYVQNEGEFAVDPGGPYLISYRAIVPRKASTENLVVPVALSASHVAYGSIRMEPVFMILGQSAASAAVQALDDGVALQDLDYSKLRQRLQQDGQLLELPEVKEIAAK